MRTQRIYGCLGNWSSIYYNVHTASSVTACGKSSIAAAGLAFEQFLANNVKFRKLDEVVTFIHHVIKEEPIRKFHDMDILDGNVSLENTFVKVMSTCGHGYIPTIEDCQIVWDILSKLTPHNLNRIYYKNNLLEFTDNTYVTNMIIEILKRLDRPFVNPNKPPKCIEFELGVLNELMDEFVFYKYQVLDRQDRLEYLPRKVTAIGDTDSAILNLDFWYRYMVDKVKGIDMRIKHEMFDLADVLEADEFGDRPLMIPATIVDIEDDYDFYDDEVIEIERIINPAKIVPNDSLRYSIINIIAYISGNMVNQYMELYTKQNNSWSPDRPCSLIMKNEFLFKRVLLKPDAKKNYASIIELQEGHSVPEDKSLDIKGLPIRKSVLPKMTQDRLQKILYEDILRADVIDQKTVLKHMILLEKDIYKSLTSGSKEYYKPAQVKSMSSYSDPMKIGAFKACVVWNELTDSTTEKHDLNVRNAVDCVKVALTPKTVNNLVGFPDIYDNAVRLLNNKRFGTGITTIAIPLGVEVPEWVFSIIDYNTIINDSLKNMPLDALNINIYNDSCNYTNIVNL